MASPITVNVKTKAQQAWSGRRVQGINSLLLINTDLNNTVLIGSDLTSLVVPIPPNGSLAVDPADNWYVIGSVAGTGPLVVLPNGQNNFLGLTQGLGSLAIPSIFAPNYVPGLTGWIIKKDGSAEFNNLVVRGSFFGLQFEIQSNGTFFYNGTPALGNLVASVVPGNANVTDRFGNTAVFGIGSYVPDGTGGITTLTGIQAAYIFYRAFASSANGSIAPGDGGGGGALLAIATEARSGDSANTLTLNSPLAGGELLWNGDHARVTNNYQVNDPNSAGNPETPHAMTPLNSWSVTSAGVFHIYKGLNNNVEVVGAVNGGTATSLNLASVGSAYRPNKQVTWAAGCHLGVAAGCSASVGMTPGGTLFATDITPGTAGMTLTVTGRYPLVIP